MMANWNRGFRTLVGKDFENWQAGKEITVEQFKEAALDAISPTTHYISDEEMLNPLFDPENIDPDNESIKALVDSIELYGYKPGAVCEVYELCGHLLCKASYEFWCALDVTKKALAGKEIEL